MATVKIVPKEHWEILREYIGADDEGAVLLVPEGNLSKFSAVDEQTIREQDGKDIEYDFGGEPDVVIDVLNDPGNYCVDILLQLDAE